MSISIFVLGIIIGGIGTLVTLIFSIISLAGGKSKNALIWGISFFFALSILVFSVFFFVRRISEKIGETVKDEMGWTQNQKSNANDIESDKESKKIDRQYFLDTLQFYTNESVKDKVPVNFYINKEAEKLAGSKIVVPFVYPLSIHYNKESSIGDIVSSQTDSVYLNNVSEMAFDQNFVIARIDNSSEKASLKKGQKEVEFVLFDMRTREYLEFESLEKLLDKSSKIGYAGPQQMTALSDDYIGWTDSDND